MAVGLSLTATVISSTAVRFEVTDPAMSDAGVDTTVTVYSDSSFQTVVATVQTDQPLGSDSYGMGVATGLTPSTTYYAKIPQNTSAVSFTTFSWGELYGSVSGQSKLVRKLYGPVAGVISLDGNIVSGGAGNVTRYYGETFLKTLRTKAPAQAANIDDIDKVQVYVRMRSSLVMEQLSISVHSSSAGTYTSVENSFDSSASVASSILRGWGFSPYVHASGTDIVNITGTTQGFLSKKITKLYGSVNGATKLIFSDLS